MQNHNDFLAHVTCTKIKFTFYFLKKNEGRSSLACYPLLLFDNLTGREMGRRASAITTDTCNV